MTTRWRKSSRCNPQGDTCVEVAALPERVLIRDSKHTGGPVLAVSPAEWTRFLAEIGARRSS